MHPVALDTRRPAETARKVRAFTLIELLVVVTIIAVLVSVLSASLISVRKAGRDFICKNKLKTVGFEFYQFADDYAKTYRGDSERLGRAGFYIEDFQEKLYGLDEFWKYSATPGNQFDPERQPLICAAAPNQQLSRIKDKPCRDGGVTPWKNVSVGLNMRLDRASTKVAGREILLQVRLNRRILDQGMVPLAFDVDGEAATREVSGSGFTKKVPHYSAPQVASEPPTSWYTKENYWYPSTRHSKRLNAVFIGGHVASSSHPVTEAGWKWKYQPAP